MLKGFIGMGAMVGILKSATKVIGEFEQANANLATILGKSRSEITDLTLSAKQLGNTTEWSASQVTALQTELAKLGFNEPQIKQMQASVLRFATAMGADLSEAAALTGSALRAFGMDASETERAVAAMAIGANRSALDFSDLQTAMATVSPVARSFGFSIEDTVSLLGVLSDAGFDASSAATATRNIILYLADANGKLAKELGKPVKTIPELSEALRTLRDRGLNLSEALELTDKRAVAAFNTFLNGTDSLNELRKSLDNVDGELERIAKERLNTLEGSTKMLKSAWESLMLSFSNSTGPIKWVVDGLTSIINGLNKLISVNKITIETVKAEIEAFAEMQVKSYSLAREYDDLKGKTKLNADEQARLDSVITQLANNMPFAIAKFDEYGRAIEINTERIYEFIEAEKARLQWVNREAIKEAEKAIRKLERKMLPLQEKIESGVEVHFGMNPNIRQLGPEELKEIGDELQAFASQKAGIVAELEYLTGKTIEDQINEAAARQEYNKKQAEFRKMDIESLEKWVMDAANATDKYFKLAKEVYDERKAPTGAGLIPEEDKAAKRERERKLKEQEKFIKKLEEYEHKLSSLTIEIRAETFKRISEDEKASYEERINAFESYQQLQLSLIDKDAEYQITELKKDLEEKGVAEEDARFQIEYIYLTAEKKKNDIVRKGAEARIKIVSDEVNKAAKAREIGEAKELLALASLYAEGSKTAEQYEKERKEIQQKYREQTFKDEISLLRDQWMQMLGDEEAQAEIMKKIQDAQLEYRLYIIDQETEAKKEKGDRLIEIEKKLLEKRKELLQEFANFAVALMDAITQRQLKELDKRLENYQNAYDETIRKTEMLEEAGAITTEQANARKAEAEQKLRDKEKEIEAERIEAEKKQFYFNQSLAAAQVAVNTAVAAMKAWAEAGPFLGGPLSAAIIAIGAVQLATILAQTVAYKDGTDYHHGGLAWVGDGYKSEAVDINGSIFKTPAVPTLVDLPKGAKVYPDFDKYLDMLTPRPLTWGNNEPATATPYNDANVLVGLKETTHSINKFMRMYSVGERERKMQSLFIHNKKSS